MSKLQRALNGILRSYGHDIMLQRRTPDGKEYLHNLERHTVRHMYPSVRGIPQIAQERSEGLTHAVDMVYYFRPEARPREGDRIYELDERYDGMDNIKTQTQAQTDGYGQSIFLIDYAVPMRGRGGRIVYWIAGCTRERPN